MKRFENMISQSLHELVEHKDTSVTFNQIETQNRRAKVNKLWITKLNVGITSVVALLLVGLISTSFIHPNTVNRSGQTPHNANTSQKSSNIDKNTYATLTKANNDFSHYHLDVPLNASKTIDLGSGIHAHYIYSSKYQTYECTWTQRNWTVGFQTYGNEQSVQQEARKIYNYIKTAKLPKANKTGVISFIPNSPFLPIVAWQDGKNIYSLKNTDPTWQGLHNLNYQNTPETQKSTAQNPLFQTSLTLPNGEVLKPDKSINWEDLSLILLISSLPPQGNLDNRYVGVIGNHSEIISHEKVTTSAGKADFVLSKRTSPAASTSKKATTEYWVIVYGTQYTYAIDATIIGNKDKAKSELMELLKNWEVPM